MGLITSNSARSSFEGKNLDVIVILCLLLRTEARNKDQVYLKALSLISQLM